jgi:hypothetical protein
VATAAQIEGKALGLVGWSLVESFATVRQPVEMTLVAAWVNAAVLHLSFQLGTEAVEAEGEAGCPPQQSR